MDIQRDPIKSKFCKLRLLCRSLAGNNVYFLTVTAPPTDDELSRVSLFLNHCGLDRSVAPSITLINIKLPKFDKITIKSE